MGELQGYFKVLSLEDKKQLKNGDHVYLPCTNHSNKHFGAFLEVKINGKPKTWKRKPERVQIPYKYGLWEHGYITENDEVRVPIEEAQL